MTVDYWKLLNEKVQKEYDDFIENLKNMPSEKVIEHACEKVIKEDILSSIEYDDFKENQLKALCSKKYPLDYCYQEWLKSDCSHMEMIEDTIIYASERALKEMRNIDKGDR